MPADLDALVTHFMSGWTISCPRERVPAARPSSRTQNSSPWPSPRFSSTAPTTAGFWPLPAGGSATCFPTCPGSRAITSASARWRRRSSAPSTRLPSARAVSVTGSGCSTRPPFPAASRARLRAAPSWLATPPTATAARTRASSGAFGSFCSAPRTACQSASSSRRPTFPSARRRPRSSSGYRSRAASCSPTKASRAATSSGS